jgi:hypothetical protein
MAFTEGVQVQLMPRLGSLDEVLEKELLVCLLAIVASDQLR